jgi:hypothetical protein
MPEPQRIFRAPRWLVAFLSLGGCLTGALAYGAYREQELSFLAATMALFAFGAVIAAINVVTTGVCLYADSLSITSGFRWRNLARQLIARVTWAKGVGVSLALADGEFVRLPDVGNSQSVSNSIRAWLKRTQDLG